MLGNDHASASSDHHQPQISIQHSINKLQSLLSSSNDEKNNHSVMIGSSVNNQSGGDGSLALILHKEMNHHLENILHIIEKNASMKTIQRKGMDLSIYFNSSLKKSKQMMKISELCVTLFKWIKNYYRLELLKQSLKDSDEDRVLVLIVEHLDTIMTHVLRQYLSRKERKMGKSDGKKKALIYTNIEKGAGGVFLELFVFALSVGCIDVKELFVIEQISHDIELKIQQIWNSKSQQDSSSLSGVFLCALICKKIGPHHLLWNDFMENVRVILIDMGSETPSREKFLKSFYNIQLTHSGNINHIIDIYKLVSISAALSCQNSRYLPNDILKYLLDSDSLYQENDDCKYIATKFLLKELKKLHSTIDPSRLLSYHIPNFEIPSDLLIFLDDIIQGKEIVERAQKMCSDEMVFMSCVLMRFFLLRRRSRISNAFYELVQKFDLVPTIFEIALEYMGKKGERFKSTYAFATIRDLLHLISENDSVHKFNRVADEIIVVAEEFVKVGKTCLDTNLEILQEWLDKIFDIILRYPKSSIYSSCLRKSFSLMLCKLGNMPSFPKTALLEVIGHHHQFFFPTSCFIKRKNLSTEVNRCLVTMVRFSAFMFLNVKSKVGDQFTLFYESVANMYRHKAMDFATQFAFLDSFYFDSESYSYKVFAIDEGVLIKYGANMIVCQRDGSLTDVIFIF